PAPPRQTRTDRPRSSPLGRLTRRPRAHARRPRPRARSSAAADDATPDRTRTRTAPRPRPLHRTLTTAAPQGARVQQLLSAMTGENADASSMQSASGFVYVYGLPRRSDPLVRRTREDDRTAAQTAIRFRG